MTDTEAQIAAGLEAAFSARGFAEPGVDALRDSAGVSLRTLYKYCPSREDMVIAALNHRHARYLDGLRAGMPDGPGGAPIAHILNRLEAWMDEEAPRGCLFLSALAAHPESVAIRNAVIGHKAQTRALMAEAARKALPQADDAAIAGIAARLLLIHEGRTAVAGPGADAGLKAATRDLVTTLIQKELPA